MAVNRMTARRKLPAPMIDRSTYSIFSVIKQAIGKDLTKFSIPVVWNEPLSFLQRLAECLEYSSLLDRASVADNITDKFHYLTAFVVSTLSAHLERMSKPFNPLLGETYEIKMEDDPSFHFISEQVSHHPPISAVHARAQNWTLSANVEPRVKFHGTNVIAISEGRWVFRIKKPSALSQSSSASSFQSCTEENEQPETLNTKTNESFDFEEEYTWRIPTVVVHNILFGRLWCEFQGQIDIKQTKSNRQSVLIIKPHSWFASQATKMAQTFKYSGFIYDDKVKIGAYHGNYGHCYYAIDRLSDTELTPSIPCSAGGHNCIHLNSNPSVPPPCDMLLVPSSRLIWYRCLSSMDDKEFNSRHEYYYFTPFTIALNEQTDSLVLPLTDSRFRPDTRYLEKGNIDGASSEKHRLEEQQRADVRKRNHDYEPLWFVIDKNGEYVYTGKYEQRIFDTCPNLFIRSSHR